MPTDEWRKANFQVRARTGWYQRGGAGPTGPVAKGLPAERRRCSHCKTNTPKKHSSICRPCEKIVGPQPLAPQEPTKGTTDGPTGKGNLSREGLERMRHVTKEVVYLNGLDFHAPESRLLADIVALLKLWPNVPKLAFHDVSGRYARMLERLEDGR